MKKITLTIFTGWILLISVAMLHAQNETKLEVKGETSKTSVFGGETFTYTFTVTNLSSQEAKNVELYHTLKNGSGVTIPLFFLSASMSQGEFKTNEVSKIQPLETFLAKFGNVPGYGTASVSVEVKVSDWGESPKQIQKFTGEKLPEMLDTSLVSMLEKADLTDEDRKNKLAELATIRNDRLAGVERLKLPLMTTYCENCVEVEQRFFRFLEIKVLPSKNVPPDIEIISPDKTKVFVKPLNKEIQVPIVVKAIDSDGRIAKVILMEEPEIVPIYDSDGIQNRVLFNRKSYSNNEFKALFSDEQFLESLQINAIKTGVDTYTCFAKNFHYGENRVTITAVDNGGRTHSESLSIKIERDAKIKITSPKQSQVLLPNSTIYIETESEINDSETDDLKLIILNDGRYYPVNTSFDSAFPSLKKVSRVGNFFRHRYVWVPQKEGRVLLRVASFDLNRQPTVSSPLMTVIVAEPRVIKITSVKNGDKFVFGKPIEVIVESKDIKGTITADEMNLKVDGKIYSRVYNSLDTNRYSDKINLSLEKGTHTLQVVSAASVTEDVSVELGKSEVIKIIVN